MEREQDFDTELTDLLDDLREQELTERLNADV